MRRWLDRPDCMPDQRIQIKKRSPAFCDLDHERPGRNVAFPERLALESHLELVKPTAAMTHRAFKPRTADSFHGLVPTPGGSGSCRAKDWARVWRAGTGIPGSATQRSSD